MIVVLAVVIGALYTGAIYLMMRRSLVKLLIGLSMLGYGANLLVFVSAGLVRGAAPIVPEGQTALSRSADPLPQALVLTAIVIGFAVFAFAIVLFQRAYEEVRTDDPDDLTSTDR